MSARQLIVLAIAFVAAIGALLVIRGMGRDPGPAPAAATSIEGVRVLVAAKDIAQGAALASGDVQWRVFPQDSINQNFIQETQRPSAPADMTGWVVRRAYVAGEPIIAATVLDPAGRGFMAAVLQPGYRAVSIEVDAESGAGSFIQPNDRVDVILTTEVDAPGAMGGSNKEIRSAVLLEDVRVLAIGEHVTPQAAGTAPTRAEGRVAVLELSQADARLIAGAETAGELRLVLRGVEVEPPGLIVESASPDGVAIQGGTARPVKVHAFGVVSDARGGR